jgi:GNAT superfamily N-acetyltransferase
MIDILIRPMRDGDMDAIIDLQWALNLFEDAISHDRVTDREGARLCVEENIAEVKQHGGALIVAESDGAVIGCLALAFAEAEAYVHPEKRRHGYVRDIVVSEHHRGGGVAQLLLAEAERLSRAAGLSGMALGMLVGNATAERAYLRFGFRPHATEMIKRFD